MLDIHEQQLRRANQQVRSRLLAGEHQVVEKVLEQYAELAKNPEQMIDLVFSEFVAREEGGEHPDCQEYYDRFPDLRQRLERIFRIHEALEIDHTESIETAAFDDAETFVPQGSNRPRAKLREVGDYEILDEIGRGGMGIVYKARHRTLGRFVALKEIKSTFVASEQRDRLLREAFAAARLQHPNVVQIYEIGEADTGPFLSMEWITDGSLDEKLSDDSFDAHEAASLVMTLAKTMDYAHQRGVIHRDLKPANVLVTETGTIKITDFGLAKILESARKAGGTDDEFSLTQSGAILGTPCYMAPEQVNGNNSEIGESADIYALGAILYELLTGRPPFRGDSPLETFQLICSTEPIPPRRFRPTLSRDLETICLQCLQKEPSRRYSSAADLAGDLRRYLNGQPILARPLGLCGRTWRWCRRQPLIAGLVMALALSVICGFITVTWQWRRADGQRLIAQRNAATARSQRAEAEKLRNEAEQERNRAVMEKSRAEENFRAAKTVIERFTQMGEQFVQWSDSEPSGKQLLRESLQFYKALMTLKSADPEDRFQTALAHHRAARIHHRLGEWDESNVAVTPAIDLLEELCEEFPRESKYQLSWAHAHFQLADGMRRAGNLEESEALFRETIRRCDVFVHDFPEEDDLQSILAIAQINWSTVAANVDRDELKNVLAAAIRTLEAVSTERPRPPFVCQHLALASECLAMYQWQAGELAEVAELLGKAIACRNQIAEVFDRKNKASSLARFFVRPRLMKVGAPSAMKSIDLLNTKVRVANMGEIAALTISPEENLFIEARTRQLLGRVVSQLDDLDQAERQLKQAVTVAKELAAAQDSIDVRVLLTTAYAELARTHLKQSRIDDAIEAFLSAAEQSGQLSADWPSDDVIPVWSTDLLDPHRVVEPTERVARAAQLWIEAIDFKNELVQQTPIDGRRRNDLALALKHLIPLMHKIGETSAIEELIRNAIVLRQQLIDQFPDEAKYQLELAGDYDDLGSHFDQLDRSADAVEYLQKSIAIRDRLARSKPREKRLVRDANARRVNLAAILENSGQTQQAIELYQAAIQLDPRATDSFNGLARLLLKSKDPRHVPEAVRLAERALELSPEDSNYANTLGAAYYRAKRYDQAVETLHQAIQNNWGRPTVESLLLLAMCEHARSNQRQAHQHLNDAISWLAWRRKWKPFADGYLTELELMSTEAQATLGAKPAAGDHAHHVSRADEATIIRLDDHTLIASAKASGREPQRQPMSEFGPSWSDDTQLWWRPRGKDMRLQLRIDVETAGVYAISGRFTKANDYGQFQLHVNGQKIGAPMECHNPGPHPQAVINSGDVDVGSARLHAGVNEFEFEITGKSPASAGYMIGIDELQLRPLDDER